MRPGNICNSHLFNLNNRLLVQLCCVVVVTIFIRCVSNDTLTGTGSQGGNGRVTCAVFDSSGNPAVNAQVYLRSYDYTVNPTLQKSASFRNTRTDSQGMFSIDSLDTGSYSIEVNDGKSHAVLLSCPVTRRDPVVFIPNAKLSSTGSIKGYIRSALKDVGKLYVQVYGLERLGVRDSLTDAFTIDDMPKGNYTLRVISSTAAHDPVDIDNVSIKPDSVVNVGSIEFHFLNQWKYSKRLILNTSSTGADVSDTVTGFPVLVRLRESNFDFSLASTNGSDIRFAKTKDKFLSHEIERWDAANKQADIWVKIDTVFGNDSTQAIMMYWGNSDATGNSNSAAVFDTGNGFSGVWHLNESIDSVKDATGNTFNGKDSGCTTKTGMIGNAKEFTKSGFVKIQGLMNSPGSITLSAWIKPEVPSDSKEIVSIGDAVLIRLDQYNDRGAVGYYRKTSAVNDTQYAAVITKKKLEETGWRFVAYSIDAGAAIQKFYIDGEQSAETHDSAKVNYIGLGTDTYIGKHGNGKALFNFTGQIDEVRISRIPLSAGWIKLSFMNQRADDALVKW